jgi:cytochrome c oxidase cbb3-type subunit 4
MTWEYEALRQLADSWGLVLTGLTFVALVGWTFRRHAGRDHARAATMIFETEEPNDG